jgi:small subunit ribosomal protein S1
MSDQVEIVAAEDAPSNTVSGETVASAQSTPEVPQATTANDESESAPMAVETVADETVAPMAAETSADETVTAESAPIAAETSAAEPVPMAEETGADEIAADDTEADDTEADDSTTDASKSNVRILSVGQQVTGSVKRIADFGAFVDIGVGRDGLIHISELSVRRVGKVTDVLSEGQEVTAWIKKLDRDRNRISLTLIDPNTKTIRDLNKDDLVQGTVTRILPYGAFVDIGIGRDALLHVREMGVGYVAKPEDVVKVGDTIEARIIELSRRRGRVDLSLKGLREEPEPTPPPMPEPIAQPQPSNSRRQRPEPQPEPEEEGDIEDLDVLSPMELAFKRAMEAEGIELNVSRKKQNKRGRREGNSSLQDEIIARTLSSGRK